MDQIQRKGTLTTSLNKLTVEEFETFIKILNGPHGKELAVKHDIPARNVWMWTRPGAPPPGHRTTIAKARALIQEHGNVTHQTRLTHLENEVDECKKMLQQILLRLPQ